MLEIKNARCMAHDENEDEMIDEEGLPEAEEDDEDLEDEDDDDEMDMFGDDGVEDTGNRDRDWM